MTPAVSSGGWEEEMVMALERQCPSNTIDRTTTADKLYCLVEWWTALSEAVTPLAILGPADGKKNRCNEPRTRQGGGIGTQDTGTVPGVGTATAAAGMNITASGLEQPTHDMPGTFGRGAEIGQESHTQTTKEHMDVAEAVSPENGTGAFTHVDFLQPPHRLRNLGTQDTD